MSEAKPVPLWKQALEQRQWQQEGRRAQGMRKTYGDGYERDEVVIDHVAAVVLAKWGVARHEIAVFGLGRPASGGMAQAARSEVIRELWRLRQAPGLVATQLGIGARTVRLMYTECRRRLSRERTVAA